MAVHLWSLLGTRSLSPCARTPFFLQKAFTYLAGMFGVECYCDGYCLALRLDASAKMNQEPGIRYYSCAMHPRIRRY